jgi:predicted transposase/invertase (TIGR01784 family)
MARRRKHDTDVTDIYSLPQAPFTPEMEREFLTAERDGLLPEEIDRFSDNYLKFLLAAPARKILLMDFINSALIMHGYEPLVDIKPVDREMSPDIHKGKGLRLDYLGTTASGEMVNLEFQKYGDNDFIKRALFCSSAIIHRQLRTGDDFSKLRRTIFIGLLDFTLFTGSKRWHWDFVPCNLTTKRVLTTDQIFIFIEASTLSRIISELRDSAERGDIDLSDEGTRMALWGSYVTNEGADIMARLKEKDKVFSTVATAERDYWGDSRNRYLQLREEIRHLDENHARNAEKRALERGLAQGMERGKAEGIAQGAELRTIEMIHNFHANGVSLDIIAKSAGMSPDEVRAILHAK